MRNATLLLAAAIALAAAACDEEPTLGQALDDLVAAAPDVCPQFCNPLVDCEWQNQVGITGPESGNLLGDTKAQCVVDCAYRIDAGVFFYEYDWDEVAQEPIYTIKGTVPGDLFEDYLACLIDSALWVCADVDESEEGEHWVYQIDAPAQESCAAYSACVEMLAINLEYEWNPAANEGAGACQASGDEFIWGDW